MILLGDSCVGRREEDIASCSEELGGFVEEVKLEKSS